MLFLIDEIEVFQELTRKEELKTKIAVPETLNAVGKFFSRCNF